jgi:quercetin dioxygenase-like cupin family protein
MSTLKDLQDRALALEKEIANKVESLKMELSGEVGVTTTVENSPGTVKLLFVNDYMEVYYFTMKAGEYSPFHHHGMSERKEAVVISKGTLWFGTQDKEEIVVDTAIVDARKLHHAKALTDVEGLAIFLPKLDSDDNN